MGVGSKKIYIVVLSSFASMKEAILDPDEVEGLWEGTFITYSQSLVDKLNTEGWNDIPPVPVIEIPERLRVGDKKYSLSDGHHRLDAARRTGAMLHAIVFSVEDDLKEVERLTGGDIALSYGAHIERLESVFNARTGKTKCYW